MLEASRDGVLLARAVARATGEGADAMFTEKGRAQWFWGYIWEPQDDGTWVTPTVAGLVMTLLVYDEEAQALSLHLFAKGRSIRDEVARSSSTTSTGRGTPGAIPTLSCWGYSQLMMSRVMRTDGCS